MIGKIFTAACLLAAGNSYGAGFAVQEQSVRAQGYAFAGGTASAEDASYMFFNPAAITHQCGYQVIAGGAYIIPSNEVKNGVASNALGQSYQGRTEVSNFADNVLAPSFYASAQLPCYLWAGIAIDAPFGLVTDYKDGWIGRYHALKSELKTININPVLAWQPTCWLSVAVGPAFQWADVELSNAVDFSSALSQPIGTADGKAVIKGDDWGVGATFGVLIEPNECLRLGFAYRSQISHKLDGNVQFTLPNPVLANAFPNSSASGSIKLPGRFHAGIHYQVNDCWALMAEYELTEWSKFKELRIVFDSDVGDSVTEELWDNSSFFAIGTSYTFSECWSARLGIAYDQSPVPDETRTPRIPDSDRFWLSGGVSYDFGNCWMLDVALTHIWTDTSKMDLKTELNPLDPDFARGNLSGDFEGNITMLSAALRWDF